MTNATSGRKKDVICSCSGTTTGQIKKLINNGVDDLESISARTGAGSGCGGCEADILALLAEYALPVCRDAINQSP